MGIRPRLRAYLYVRERSAPLPSHAQTRLASTSPSALLPALTSPLGGPGTLSSVRRVSPYNIMSPAKSMLFVVACAAAGAAQAADVTLIWGSNCFAAGCQQFVDDMVVGDILTFDVQPGHNVWQWQPESAVSEAEFNTCTFNATNGEIWATDSETKSFQIGSTDTMYFACEIGGHCQQGIQKVLVQPKLPSAPAPAPAVP